jgi:hypothetical protein
LEKKYLEHFWKFCYGQIITSSSLFFSLDADHLFHSPTSSISPPKKRSPHQPSEADSSCSYFSEDDIIFTRVCELEECAHLKRKKKISTQQFILFKAIAAHLFNKEDNAHQCYDELQQIYHGLCPESETIRDWYHLYRAGNFKIYPRKHTGRRKKLEILDPLKKAVEKDRTRSARLLGKIVSAHHQTVIRRLEEDLEMRQARVWKVPHLLSEDQIEIRKEFAEEMKSFLLSQREDEFKRIFTGDESWIWYDNSSKKMWIEKGEEAPERISKDIGSRKILLTVFFNGQRVWHISFLPQGETMNSDKFIGVLQDLHSKLLSEVWPPTLP